MRRDPPREMSDDHESDKLKKPSEATLLVQFLGWASFEDITLRDAFTIAQDRHSLYHDLIKCLQTDNHNTTDQTPNIWLRRRL